VAGEARHQPDSDSAEGRTKLFAIRAAHVASDSCAVQRSRVFRLMEFWGWVSLVVCWVVIGWLWR
jgi:hypothetical protein